MIFSGDLADKVLAGTKTQTRRPVKDYDAPCRYLVGKTYAIQRKRGTHGLGPRILILSVAPAEVAEISDEDARAEGFADRTGFLARWSAFYGKPFGRCWRIEFVLTSDCVAVATELGSEVFSCDSGESA